jgi:hypothetical protein
VSSAAYDDSSDELSFPLSGETDGRPFVCSLYLLDSVRIGFCFESEYCLSDPNGVVALPFVPENFLLGRDDSGTVSGDVSTKQVTLIENHTVVHNKISLTLT